MYIMFDGLKNFFKEDTGDTEKTYLEKKRDWNQAFDEYEEKIRSGNPGEQDAKKFEQKMATINLELEECPIAGSP